MDNNIDWIYNLEDEFRLNNKDEIINISDWNNEDSNIFIPNKLLVLSSKISSFEYSKYYFIETIKDSKTSLSNFIKLSYKININKNNILLVNNSTYAIYLVCKSLKELNLNRALLITPLYFSIEHNLKKLDFSLTYYHLTNENNFNFNLENISKLLDEQYIEVVFLTNPIFCVGQVIKHNDLVEFLELIISRNIWIVIDNTLGEMTWNKNNKLLNIFLLEMFTKYDKLIYIDSASKKLFINGLKNSIIISSLHKNTSIEYDSDYNIGSLTVNQVNLINEIYNVNNQYIVDETMNSNIDLFMNNYILCKNLIEESDYYIVDTNSGFHTCIMHKRYKSFDINQKSLIKKLLFKHNIIFFPLEHFSFHNSNNFGFRINLSKHPSKLTKALKCLINIDL